MDHGPGIRSAPKPEYFPEGKPKGTLDFNLISCSSEAGRAYSSARPRLNTISRCGPRVPTHSFRIA